MGRIFFLEPDRFGLGACFFCLHRACLGTSHVGFVTPHLNFLNCKTGITTPYCLLILYIYVILIKTEKKKSFTKLKL